MQDKWKSALHTILGTLHLWSSGSDHPSRGRQLPSPRPKPRPGHLFINPVSGVYFLFNIHTLLCFEIPSPTFVFLRRALARQISCLWPTLRFSPPSDTSCWNIFGGRTQFTERPRENYAGIDWIVPSPTCRPEARPVTKSARWDCRREDQTAASLWKKCNQYTSRREVIIFITCTAQMDQDCVWESQRRAQGPVRKIDKGGLNVDEGELEGDLDDATWGMIVSLLLNLCNPNFEISTPSMRIRPLAGSISLLWERCLKLTS